MAFAGSCAAFAGFGVDVEAGACAYLAFSVAGVGVGVAFFGVVTLLATGHVLFPWFE
jgi:hypothetical protein